jgi:dihydrolipoamide dehydrogenase
MAVALVEKGEMGGTCLHRGCVPTKAYLHASEAAQSALAFAPDAVARFDRQAMLARKNETVAQLTAGLHMLMKANKITVYKGIGTLQSTASPFRVSLAPASGEDEALPEELSGRYVLLATGSQPARIPVPGCDDSRVWTSDDILGEPGAQAFQSLAIIGGGVIGVEIACVYARLGVDVTIVEAEKNCLPMMDRELSRSAESMLKAMGVRILTGARLQEVQKKEDGFTLRVEKSGAEENLPCERVLLATGRRAYAQGLFGEGVAPAMERRAVTVDEHFQTDIPGVYAIGDVNGQMQLAHAAHAQGLAAVSHMLGQAAPTDTRWIPSCVYTTPEIASVGIGQDEAKARGIEVVCGKALTTQNARSLIEGLGRGFIKLVFDKETRKLIGAQLFCGRATDLIGELTLAIANGLTAEQLMKPLRAHPTFYEAVTEAAAAARSAL